MAPASGVMAALAARPAASAVAALSASPCRGVFLIDVASAGGVVLMRDDRKSLSAAPARRTCAAAGFDGTSVGCRRR